ncbi:hypothetical protein CHU95_03420 [Niveispirillum lacus]|uniref:DUF927 domain-containing protein n=1 Tax=Niveispirillum lacus TaxID=1981099 RepID=A0A255Z5X2_9PROT|nr:DUF927 domain-containing protein [Niveispirillum lacus]OYQ36832.1 hypothetical protein CHU95_03420 [Niveispirillum lacus]
MAHPALPEEGINQMASSNEIKARIVGAEADRASVEQVLAAIGVTAKVGGSWASCPLCGRKRTDKTFKVNESGTCQCQKCQRPKNVLDLVMEIRGHKFLDAIAFVGEVIGLPLDRNGRPGVMPAKGARPAARDFRPVQAEPRRAIPVPAGKPRRSFVAPDGQEIQTFAPREGMQAELPSRLSSVPVDREARDRGYRILLDHLALKPQHRRWLNAKRGFGDGLIDRRLYRSLPKVADMAAAVDAAVAEMGIEVAVALPGLVVREVGGKPCWMLGARYSGSKDGGFPNQGETGDGLLTPVMDADGLVVALRVRSHVPSENGGWDKKVTWMSSNYAGGASPGAPFHHAVPGQLVDASTILVTEGEDKAQAAAEHFGCRALSLPGLNPAAGEAIVRELELVLSRYGDEIRAVGIALDMDPPSNLNATRDAFITISIVREFCARRGLEFAVGSWDGVKGKGIDDAIRAGAEADWLTGPEIDEHLTLLKGDREIELPRRNAGPAAGPDLLAELDVPVWDGSEDQAGAGELYRYDADGMPTGPVGWATSDPPAPGEAMQPAGQPNDETEADPGDFFAHLDAGPGDAPLPELNDLAVKDGQAGDVGGQVGLLNRGQMADRPGLPEVAFKLVGCPRFSVGRDGIFLSLGEDRGSRSVTMDPIVPVAVSRNLETGEEELVVMHWRRGAPGRWVTLRMDARILASRNHLAALAAHGLEVNIQNAGDLSLYLSVVFRLNGHLLPVMYSTSRMGLQEVDGRWMCLLGDRCISAAGVTAASRSDTGALAGALSFKPTGAGETALADIFSTKGTIDGQRELMALVAGFPKARVILNAALAASVVTLARRPGFVLDVYAPNGSSKSTLTRLAASTYGRADDSGGHVGQEIPWSSTLPSMELRGGTLGGLPMYIDDSKHLAGHGGGEKASSLIYTVGGGGKLRAEMGGTGTRSKKVMQTVAISTGESALAGLLPANDGGAKTRLLHVGHPIPVKSPEMAAVADKIKAGVHRHFGHLGTEWMAFLLSKLEAHDAHSSPGAFAKLLNDAIDAETMRLARKAPGHLSAARLAGYAAAINVAAGLASMCTVNMLDGSAVGLYPWEQELVDTVEYPEGGAPPAGVPVGRVVDGDIWAGMLEHAEDSAGDLKALDSVYAWAVANQTAFGGRFDPEKDRPRELLGVWKQDTREKPWVALYILLPALEGYLKQQGFVPSQVLAAWKEKGITKCDPGRVTTKSVCIAGSYPRVVAIKREALMAQENGEGQAPQRELALG